MSFLSGFLPSHGLYGHIQKNNAKSLLLLAAFLLLFELLNFIAHAGGMARARMEFARMEAATSLSRQGGNTASQPVLTAAQKELAETRAAERSRPTASRCAITIPMIRAPRNSRRSP